MFLHKNVLKFSKHRFSENLKLFGRAFLIFLHRNVLKCRKMRFFRNFEIIRKNFFQNFEIFWFTAFRFFNSFSEFLMKNFWKTKKYELRRIADFDVYFYWIFWRSILVNKKSRSILSCISDAQKSAQNFLIKKCIFLSFDHFKLITSA